MDPLEPLKKVQKVAAPPFLYTRIQAKIQQQTAEYLPPRWQWAAALTLGLFVVANLYLLQQPAPFSSNSGPDALVNSLNLNTSNQLYHD
jgi:H+/Cl- antiporter ClcA